ncbi:class II aldolase/adducin family protein [Nocardiopsis composta]|uniref:L-fuculose-phosphate aldolase n=1 Tax=Nocardiopsis composta TaxID=157465 RepID=A0A7W8VEI6_9ACTN|nr:class II aldolase/adducin family protein [Nocardiopsis composta]MBB5433347.1 L-fuculose-phosphate aldolase [Nocardiopsis composta]
MLLEQERRDVALTAHRLAGTGAVLGRGGAVSVRCGDLFAVTPADLPLGRIEPADCPVLSVEGGGVVEGRRGPAADTVLHTAVYRHGEAGAVVQSYGEHAAAVSAVLAELPPVHRAAARLGGAVPVAPYSVYGGGDLADQAVKALKGRQAALLACNGAVAVGGCATEAFDNVSLLEWLCGVYVEARRLGEPRVLSEDELAEVRERDRSGWAGPDPFLF